MMRYLLFFLVLGCFFLSAAEEEEWPWLGPLLGYLPCSQQLVVRVLSFSVPSSRASPPCCARSKIFFRSLRRAIFSAMSRFWLSIC